MTHYKFIRYINFSHLFELFFLSAIISIVLIRLYLQITGFPQIGSGEFHVAHLLFGGFFMLFSILGLLTYLNDDLKPLWAVLGGIGFGTFIDELGKFITKDNNYFFQPTFAIIYVIFILLYLLYKSIEHIHVFTEDEYLINSLNLLEDVIIKDLDKEEKEEALRYLKLSDQQNLITKLVKNAYAEMGPVPDEKLSLYTKIKNTCIALYHLLLKQPWFLQAIAVLFIIRAVGYIITGLSLILNISHTVFSGEMTNLMSFHGIIHLIQFLALTMQALFTVIGTLTLWRSRRDAYLFFRDAVLVSVFVLQVFHFMTDPDAAFLSTVGDLLLLSILQYMINREKRMVHYKTEK